MIDYERHFQWPDVHIEHFIAYFFVAFLVAAYLVFKSNAKYKIEVFFLSFYLITGNTNDLLTLKIPGISLFEIQPFRLIFLILSFLLLRKTLFKKRTALPDSEKKTPWFVIALLVYVIWAISSLIYNSAEMELNEMLVSMYENIAFLVLLAGISLMKDRPTYEIIGKTILIGAAFSSIISIAQLTIDPYFLRIGEARLAFGNVIRSNGIFVTEYFNSYYLIIAIIWTLSTVKQEFLKYLLIGLFILGVLSSFQRMSWIVLAIVLITYFVFIQKLAFEKILLMGLSGLAVILIGVLLFYQDIMKSSVVEDRLLDTPGGRAGYYQLVLDNIDRKPVFGYGDLKNDVYYINMMKISRNRARASAEIGDLHSGYFSALFLHGIPAFVSFFLFVLLSVFYYAKRYKENEFFTIALLVCIVYMVGNLTNNFLILKYIAIIVGIHLGIAIGVSNAKGTNRDLAA